MFSRGKQLVQLSYGRHKKASPLTVHNVNIHTKLSRCNAQKDHVTIEKWIDNVASSCNTNDQNPTAAGKKNVPVHIFVYIIRVIEGCVLVSVPNRTISKNKSFQSHKIRN